MICPYLDDCVLEARYFQEARKAVDTMIRLFTELSLQINIQKPSLIPVQCLESVGANLDTLQAKALLPQHKFLSVVSLIGTIQYSPRIPARLCL